MNWLRKAAGALTGATRRDEDVRAAEILARHEQSATFDRAGALAELSGVMGESRARRVLADHAVARIAAVVETALEDGVLGPDEETAIAGQQSRYGTSALPPALATRLARAKEQYSAWATPLAPVDSPLMLQKGEWCAHGVAATASEERQQTVRVNYRGTSTRIRLAKGVYYRVGSVKAQRQVEAYQHEFGHGVLAATSKRLLWVSPQKSISVAYGKIVMFEPFTDGLRVIKDTGKPLLFTFDDEDAYSMVRLSRAIEELRS